jgi:hypothetical protein
MMETMRETAVAEQERPIETQREAPGRRDAAHDRAIHVRAADLEPYVGLRYVAKLFRVIALILMMLLLAEVVIGFYQQGWAAVPTLLGEGSRLLVLAGMLWGAGDLAILMIDIGHDVRATRILVGRQGAHLEHLEHLEHIEHHPRHEGPDEEGERPHRHEAGDRAPESWRGTGPEGAPRARPEPRDTRR